MSNRMQGPHGQKTGSLSMVLLLLFASLAGLVSLPVATANESGDVAILDSVSPLNNSWGSSWDPMTFTITVQNQGLGTSQNRITNWFVCAGDVTAPVCKSTPDASGSFSLGNLFSGTTVDFTSGTQWNPSGDQGTFTIVYAFALNDQDAADDVLRFTLNLTRSYVDLEVDSTYNPLSDLEGTATYDGQIILNSGESYTINSKGQVNACGTCNFEAELGWQLWTTDQVPSLLDEAYTNVTNLPSWGGQSPFTRQLPALSSPSVGEFTLKWGLFNSTGTPYGDLDPSNDIAQMTIIFDDTIDLQATSMLPSHDAGSANYYYGEDMVTATVSNIGNKTIDLVSVAFQIYDPIGEVEYETICVINAFIPGETRTCLFNVTSVGADRTLTIQVPSSHDEGDESKFSNNALSEVTDLVAGAINANIDQASSTGTYTTGENIQMSARTSSTAAGPLNYSWWVSGIINLAYGPELNVSGTNLGLGDHIITLRVTDVFGELQSVHKDITVYDYISLDNGDLFTGQAVARSSAYLRHEASLPVLGTSYGIGEGKQPLLLLSFEILSTEDDSPDVGMDWMDIQLNLSALLPENIPLESVDVRYLPTMDDYIWTYLDQYVTNEDGTIDVTLTTNGVILIIGDSPPANLSAGPITSTQLEGGQLALNWTAEGDSSNPYVGGWNIYKLMIVQQAGTLFPNPANGVNEFIWNELTSTSLVASIDPSSESWVDPVPLATGDCASYAIMPASREGTPDFEHINVSLDDNGQATAFCGDAIPPVSSITNFQHTSAFTNDTECYKLVNDWNMCYELNLTWMWPENEPNGQLFWNLYMVEQQPSEIDVRFLTPLMSNIASIPGETGYYNTSGVEDSNIRPLRTYYFILAPVDSVGNEQLIADYPSPNIERVTIEDDWWSYYQHLIPEPEPEPEPPLGVPWLGTLTDYMQEDEFTTTGLASLIVLVLSIISLPLLLQKRKRLKRIMAARNRRAGVASTADEFDDFFD
ncbi:MAG: hypothetical protein ACJZ40_05825 [Candidatus Poseidoniaceae archaeon]